jgi:hypothetical protein
MIEEKIYYRRKLERLESPGPSFWQIGQSVTGLPVTLSMILNGSLDSRRSIYLCGSLEEMSREYVEEPLENGWEFARKYIHKYRSPVYRHKDYKVEKAVKLVGESWFPGCEDMNTAIEAWKALESEWSRTGLPLMSTPATTGMALLWQTLPFGDGARALPDDLARHIRRISPQHRKQRFDGMTAHNTDYSKLHQYDGRFMYAAMCQRDRYPIGEPYRVGGFREYEPGFYDVVIRIPAGWDRLGLIPVPDYERAEKFGTLGWVYPNESNLEFRTWVAEPELTFAIKNGWHLIAVADGWAFDKGRPLDVWAKKLIEMRDDLRQKEGNRVEGGEVEMAPYRFAAAAVREILTNTIGRLHKNTVEREAVVNHEEWRELIRKWGYAGVTTKETPDEREDGLRLVEHPEPNHSDFMIFLPHVSATLYSLARVEVLKYALRINRDHLIEIDGDAVYTSAPQRWMEEADEGKIGQLRRKE